MIQCGGSLIDNQHIVTATHCVAFTEEVDGRSITCVKSTDCIDVYLGILESNSPFQRSNVPLEISKVWFDTDFYRPLLSNDLAILTLKNPVTFGPKIYPICLPNSEDNLSKLVVAGWGYTGAKGPASNELLEVDVDYIPSMCLH